MDPNERRGWLEIIKADELDGHMASIGQAETNANLVKEMFKDFPLEACAKLLVPGCGTGQMFDYIAPDDLGTDIVMSFSDINPAFFERLEERMKKFEGVEYSAKADNFEDTKFSGEFDAALVVLLLHHIEWKRGLKSSLKLGVKNYYIIIQEQASGEPITKERELFPSIKEFSKVAGSDLVNKKELIDFMEENGFRLLKEFKRDVPDNKIMTGLIFKRN